jgi:hypothetical protein
MVYRGHVENGIIRIDAAPPLPEGAEVEVRFLAECPSEVNSEAEASLCERLEDVVGKAEGLPRMRPSTLTIIYMGCRNRHETVVCRHVVLCGFAQPARRSSPQSRGSW